MLTSTNRELLKLYIHLFIYLSESFHWLTLEKT